MPKKMLLNEPDENPNLRQYDITYSYSLLGQKIIETGTVYGINVHDALHRAKMFLEIMEAELISIRENTDD